MSLFVILIISAFYGATMKLADLFNEHGLRWFKGDAILFGLLWGLSGALLSVSRPDVGNVVIAMILASLVRMRLDYVNHAIAATIIIIVFLWEKTFFDMFFFLLFFSIFVLAGGWRDYLGDIRKKKDWLYKINEPMWYYTVPTAVYGFVSHDWVLFFVFIVFTVFYNAVKYGLFWMKKYQTL